MPKQRKDFPVLSLHDIHLAYGFKEVLKGISLNAYSSDVIAILGSSGSGKSSLLRCINLLEMPQKGEVHFRDERIILQETKKKQRSVQTPAQLTRLRSNIGMVFQQFNLWSHLTVLQNIMETPICVLKKSKEETREQALQLLNKVGLDEELKDSYPVQLSGGQQQRVAIARTLAMNPALILFDEPTSALDPTLVHEVLQVIAALAKEQRTMIIVTHEMAFARNVSTRVIFLHDGRIEVDGAPTEVFSKNRNPILRRFLRKEMPLS